MISQREAALPYSSEEILQKASILIIVADSQGAITYVSPSVKTILGYEPSDLLGDKWWQVTRTDPQDQAREKDYVARGARGEIPISFAPYERRIRHPGACR